MKQTGTNRDREDRAIRLMLGYLCIATELESSLVRMT